MERRSRRVCLVGTQAGGLVWTAVAIEESVWLVESEAYVISGISDDCSTLN